MRVGFVSEWYDPEGGSAAIPGTISRALASRGLEVEVLTGYPNYPYGRVFPGVRQRLHSFERSGSLGIHRVPLHPNHSESAVQRTLSYASFAATSTVIGMPSLKKCDAYFVYSTPILMGLGPMIAGRLRSTPVLTYVPDLWPDSMVASGLASRGRIGASLTWLATRFSNLAYNSSRALACTSEGIRSTLIERGARPESTHTVYNWVDEQLFAPDAAAGAQLRDEHRLQGKFIAMYAGNLGALQDIETLLEAARSLKHHSDIVFMFVGSGALESKVSAAALELDNVVHLPNQELDQMPALIAMSDVQIMSLIDHPLFEFTIPSKLQFATACAKPVLAAMRGEAADLVAAGEAGVVVPPGSPTQVADAITALAGLSERDRADMGQRARALYDRTFSEAVGAARLVEILTSMTKDR